MIRVAAQRRWAIVAPAAVGLVGGIGSPPGHGTDVGVGSRRGSHPVPVVHHRRRTRRRPAELLSLKLGLLAELKNVPLGVKVFGSCVGPVFLDLGSFRREANGGSAALVVSLGVAFVVGRIRRGCCGLFIAACRLGIAVVMMLRNGR